MANVLRRIWDDETHRMLRAVCIAPGAAPLALVSVVTALAGQSAQSLNRVTTAMGSGRPVAFTHERIKTIKIGRVGEPPPALS